MFDMAGTVKACFDIHVVFKRDRKELMLETQHTKQTATQTAHYQEKKTT